MRGEGNQVDLRSGGQAAAPGRLAPEVRVELRADDVPPEMCRYHGRGAASHEGVQHHAGWWTAGEDQRNQEALRECAVVAAEVHPARDRDDAPHGPERRCLSRLLGAVEVVARRLLGEEIEVLVVHLEATPPVRVPSVGLLPDEVVALHPSVVVGHGDGEAGGHVPEAAVGEVPGAGHGLAPAGVGIAQVHPDASGVLQHTVDFIEDRAEVLDVLLHRGLHAEGVGQALRAAPPTACSVGAQLLAVGLVVAALAATLPGSPAVVLDGAPIRRRRDDAVDALVGHAVQHLQAVAQVEFHGLTPALRRRVGLQIQGQLDVAVVRATAVRTAKLPLQVLPLPLHALSDRSELIHVEELLGAGVEHLDPAGVAGDLVAAIPPQFRPGEPRELVLPWDGTPAAPATTVQRLTHRCHAHWNHSFCLPTRTPGGALSWTPGLFKPSSLLRCSLIAGCSLAGWACHSPTEVGTR